MIGKRPSPVAPPPALPLSEASQVSSQPGSIPTIHPAHSCTWVTDGGDRRHILTHLVFHRFRHGQLEKHRSCHPSLHTGLVVFLTQTPQQLCPSASRLLILPASPQSPAGKGRRPTEKAHALVCAPLIPRPLHSSLREEDPLQPAFPVNPTSHPSPLSLLSLPTLSLSLLSSFSHTYFLLKPKQKQTLSLTCYYSSHSSTSHLPFPATLLDSALPTCRHPACLFIPLLTFHRLASFYLHSSTDDNTQRPPSTRLLTNSSALLYPSLLISGSQHFPDIRITDR